VEGLSLASRAKTAVSEHYAENGSFCESNAECSLPPAESLSGQYVTSVAVGAGALVTVTYGASPITGETIVLTPREEDYAVVWSCTDGTLPMKYRPSSCRQ
jgi:type IV pilus assembly protein PilA